MKIILLSGGSGTRLWPLSSDAHPKQLLKLLSDERGEPVSMLQTMWRRLKQRHLESCTVIAAASVQQQQIRAQLGSDIGIVPEPLKRDTFPAVLLAVSYLNTYQEMEPDEPIIVLPVDSRAEAAYYDTVFRLPAALAQSGANLALLGVKPGYASEKFGYMIPDRNEGDEEAELPLTPFPILRFHEKPEREVAAALIRQGALWNGGVFCFRASYLLDRIKDMGLPQTYPELLTQFPHISAQSFDYAVVEKERSIVALAYDGAWKDIGTWCSLSEEMGSPIVGRGVMTEDCNHVHIVNTTNTPVIAMGLTDVVIAVSEEGILVSSKPSSHRLKTALRLLHSDSSQHLAAAANAQTLDRTCQPDGTTVTTRKLQLAPGSSHEHRHAEGANRSVVWTVLAGYGELEQQGHVSLLQVGDTVILRNRETGTLHASAPLELLEVQTVFG
jgi:mannose-1-phosphate guanylyltransferase